jgi:hypothetical protein
MAAVNASALVFQGHVITNNGEVIAEVIHRDLPDDVTQPGNGALRALKLACPCPQKAAHSGG